MKRYFDEYLFLGGIDTLSQFNGYDPRDLKDMTPEERREVAATDRVYGSSLAGTKFYDGDTSKWFVDFTAVVKGFLSSPLLELTHLEEKSLGTAIGVVENFLRYVLHHGVCPEYEQDVKTALEACSTAREEWPAWAKLQATLPGQFHMAARELFAKKDSTSNSWNGEGVEVPEGFDATAVFYSTVALMEDDHTFSELFDHIPFITGEFDCTLKVERVIRPNVRLVDRFRGLALDDEKTDIPAVGTAVFSSTDQILDEFDHPLMTAPFSEREKDIRLYFNDDVLENMRPGMRMALRLCELDTGTLFVKSIIRTVPTFYTFLPQELMKGFKEVKENERPAPSIHHPNGEETEMAEEASCD